MTSHDPEIVARFSESLRARNRQPATVESYSRDAQDFLRFLEQSHLNIESVEPETLLWFRDYLRDAAGERENSVRRKVIGVRQFFRFLAEEQTILASPFDAMPIPERDDSLDEGLSETRLKALLELVTETGFKSRRDRALLHLLAFEGLKASEIIDLRWRDLIQGKELQTLSVPGLKSRTIQLQESTAQSLSAYASTFQAWLASQRADDERPSARGRSVPLTHRRPPPEILHPVGDQPAGVDDNLASYLENRTPEQRFPWMFVAFKGKELPLVLPRMTRHGLKFMLHELGEKLGVKHLHTETLRHHAMCYHLALGRNPEDVMQHLGLRRLGNIGKHLAQYRNQP